MEHRLGVLRPPHRRDPHPHRAGAPRRTDLRRVAEPGDADGGDRLRDRRRPPRSRAPDHGGRLVGRPHLLAVVDAPPWRLPSGLRVHDRGEPAPSAARAVAPRPVHAHDPRNRGGDPLGAGSGQCRLRRRSSRIGAHSVEARPAHPGLSARTPVRRPRDARSRRDRFPPAVGARDRALRGRAHRLDPLCDLEEVETERRRIAQRPIGAARCDPERFADPARDGLPHDDELHRGRASHHPHVRERGGVEFPGPPRPAGLGPRVGFGSFGSAVGGPSNAGGRRARGR